MICKCCGQEYENCFFCEEVAEYEGWYNNGGILSIRIKVCENHATGLRGYDAEKIKELRNDGM